MIAALHNGDSIEEIAKFLQYCESTVRAKMKELVDRSQLPLADIPLRPRDRWAGNDGRSRACRLAECVAKPPIALVLECKFADEPLQRADTRFVLLQDAGCGEIVIELAVSALAA